jgi:hypothetical protein
VTNIFPHGTLQNRRQSILLLSTAAFRTYRNAIHQSVVLYRWETTELIN